LLYRYLQDIKQRKKMGEFGRATACTILRKCTRLEDIESIIEDLQAKSNDLLSNAEKMALRLKEEAEAKQI
jgi:predicted transcriptional regulator